MIFDPWVFDVLSGWELLVADGWTPEIIDFTSFGIYTQRVEWTSADGESQILCG